MQINNRNLIIAAAVVVLAAGVLWWEEIIPFLPKSIDLSIPSESAVKTGTKAGTSVSKPSGSVAALPQMTKEGIYLIEYRSSGFSPRYLTIPAGKSVRFVNNSGKGMRITSLNTTSTIMGAFNQGKTVGKGGIYEFTFNDRAVYNYTNSNNSADTGGITVQ